MSTPAGPPPPDLLVSGEDRAPRERSAFRRGRAGAAVALLAAAVVTAGVLVQQDRAADERRRLAAEERGVVLLSLPASGEDGGRRHRLRPPGVRLAVENAGPATVRLLWATVEPVGWQVSVPPHRGLRPGRSLQLQLTPPRACGTPAPRGLRVEGLPPDGRPRTAALDLTRARLAHGGTLEDAVAAAALDCDPGIAAGSDGRTYPHRS